MFAFLIVMTVAPTARSEDVAPLLSPRLEQLAQALTTGGSGAVQGFWREIGEAGAPLVEPIPGDPAHSLVTFLWRGDADTRNVVVICCDNSQLASSQFLDMGRMARLGNSDIWFRTYRLRNDARFSYRFSPNDPLTPSTTLAPDATVRRAANIRPDPMNPRVVTTRNGPAGLLELPAAPRSRWIATTSAASHGRVNKFRFTSAVLGNSRDVWVYTPPGDPCSASPCDLLVVFDGDGYLENIPAPTILDNLIAAGTLRPTIAVMIGNAERARLRELWYSDDFNTFLVDELMPWIRVNYPVTAEPQGVTVAGSSLGGTAALYAALEHPEVFGGVVSQSGGLMNSRTREEMFPQRIVPGQLFEDGFPQYEWLARHVAETPGRPVRIFLEVGLMEDVSFDWTPPRFAYPSMVEATRHFRDVLQARGYDVSYSEYNGHHEHWSWRESFGDALAWVARRPAVS